MVKMYVCPKCGHKSFNGFTDIYTSNKIKVVHNIQTGLDDDIDIDYEEFIESICHKCGATSFDHSEEFIQDVAE